MKKFVKLVEFDKVINKITRALSIYLCWIFFFFWASVCAHAAAPTTPTATPLCSSNKTSVMLNEMKSQGGGSSLDFVELFILGNAVSLTGYRIWAFNYSGGLPSGWEAGSVANTASVELGAGKGCLNYAGTKSGFASCSLKDSSGSTFNYPTYILYTLPNMNQNDGAQFALFDSAGKLVDQISYDTDATSCSANYWTAPAACLNNSGCLAPFSPSSADMSRSTDGSGDWVNNGSSKTQGATNTIGAPPGGAGYKFKANPISICASGVPHSVTLTAAWVDSSGVFLNPEVVYTSFTTSPTVAVSASVSGSAVLSSATPSFVNGVSSGFTVTDSTVETVTLTVLNPAIPGTSTNISLPMSSCGPDRFRLTHNGTGGVCTGQVVTVRSCSNAACAAPNGSSTAVTLAPASGIWSLVSGGSLSGSVLTLNAGSDAVLNFKANTAGTTTYGMSAGSPAPTASVPYVCSLGAALENATTECQSQFTDNEFVVSSVDALGNVAVAGRPHAMRITAYKKEAPTGQCGIATGYSGNKDLRAWYSDVSALSPLPSAPTLAKNANCTSPLTLGASDPGSNNLSALGFASGLASFWACTSDVGKGSFLFKDVATPLIGTASSDVITVRPFALLPVVAGSSASTPAQLADGGAQFTNGGSLAIAAGDSFSASVKSLLWTAADDANNDGIPDAGSTLTDNFVTPSFNSSIPLFATNPAPASASPLLRQATTAAATGSWTGGVWNGSLNFDNVGAFQLQTGPLTSYLGTALSVPAATTGSLGRFKPHHFGLASPSFTTGCGIGSTLTYLGQDFSLSFAIHALNAAGTVATGYGAAGYAPVVTGGRYTLLGTSGASSFDTGSATGLLPNASAVSPTVLQVPAAGTGVWSAGVVSYPGSSGQTGAFQLFRPTAATGPFNGMNISARFVDNTSDATPFWGLTSVSTNPVCAATSICTALLGTTNMRYGRIRVDNAFGSEKLDLPLPAQVQYWTGNYWKANDLDQGCTNLPAPILTNSAGTGTVTVKAGSVMEANPQGLFGLVLSSTGQAAVDATFGVSSWLKFPWHGGSVMADPKAKVSFGLYKGSNRFIYRREIR